MKLSEMQFVVSDTLALFVRTMPDTPFTVDDVVIEFAPKTKMAERIRDLCAQYAPDKKHKRKPSTGVVKQHRYRSVDRQREGE